MIKQAKKKKKAVKKPAPKKKKPKGKVPPSMPPRRRKKKPKKKAPARRAPKTKDTKKKKKSKKKIPMKWVQPALGKHLGSGLSRDTYVKKSNPKRVIKIANTGEFHRKQQCTEIKRAGKSFLFAKIYAYGFNWIEMERCDTSDLKSALNKNNLTFTDLTNLEYSRRVTKKNPILVELRRLISELKLRDFANVGNWGLSASGKLKLIDFGCSQDDC